MSRMLERGRLIAGEFEAAHRLGAARPQNVPRRQPELPRRQLQQRGMHREAVAELGRGFRAARRADHFRRPNELDRFADRAKRVTAGAFEGFDDFAAEVEGLQTLAGRARLAGCQISRRGVSEPGVVHAHQWAPVRCARGSRAKWDN